MRKIYAFISIMMLSVGSMYAAAPTWVSTPVVTNLTALNFNLTFQLSGTSNAYIVVYGGDYTWLSSAQVKSASGSGTIPQRPYVKQLLGISGPQTLYIDGSFFNPSTVYTVAVVGENGATLQATPFFIYPLTTPVCANLNVATSRFEPEECVNKGVTFILDMPGVNPDPQISGVYKGTTWTINWGDGTADMNYTSTSNGDFPSVALRTHPYPSITNCVYTVKLNITSPAPCSKFFTVSYQVFVHGRDQLTDGDGTLLIVDSSTGLSGTIPVCEGNSHTIILKDMSTWNCQNPILGGLPFAPAKNNSIRTIQWLYGIDNSGTLQNTIGQLSGTTPKVYIGGAVNFAQRTVQGYTQPVIAPAAYQGELSQTIQIPATCKAGEIFNVYLRNWNKCNIYGIDPPIFTQIQILVVASPAPPTVTNRTICYGDATTLTAGHGVPAGTIISWYANADKTGFITTGNTYSPAVADPGGAPVVHTYYVADKGNVSGNLCEGPTTPITLTVQPVIANNTAAGGSTICYNTVPAGLTGTAPSGGSGAYTYLWESSTVGAGGPWAAAAATNNTQNYSPPALIATTWYHRVVTSGACSNTSNVRQIIVTPLNTITLTSAVGTDNQTICINTAITNITYSTTGATGATFSGLPAGVGGAWAGDVVTISGTPTSSGTFNYTITLTGGCGVITKTGTINVTPDNTITRTSAAGTDNQTKCINTAITNITYSTTTASGATFSGLPAGVGGVWAGNIITISGTPTASGIFNYTITLTGGCGVVTKNGTITVNPLPVPTIGGPSASCIGATGNVYTTEAGMGAYTWLVSAGGLITAGGGPANNTVTVKWNLAGAQSVSVNYTNGNGCTAAAPTVYPVSVGTSPTTATLVTSGDACFGASTWIKSVITGGGPDYIVNYTINGVAQPVINPYASNTNYDLGVLPVGSYLIALTSVTDLCGGLVPVMPAPVTVVVKPIPTATINGTATVCQSAAAPNITFTNPQAFPVTVTYKINAGANTTINVAASSAATLAAPTGVSGVFTYNLVNVFYQAAPSCSNVIAGSATITVTPTVGTPTVPAPSATTICQGSAPAAYTTSATDATSYNWSVTGAGNSIAGAGTTGTVTWAAGYSGTATVSVTANGCSGPSASASTTVVVRPTPAATITGTTDVCLGGAAPNVTFTNPMALSVTVTYNINGGANNVINIGASTSVNLAAPTGVAGTFNYNLVSVVYQTAPACSNAIAGTATVIVRPTPTATINGTTSVCQGGALPVITFTNPQAFPVTVTYNINGGANTTINVGSATTATVAAPTAAAGSFVYNLVNVFYTAAPSCTNVIAGSATVTVRPTPTATISGTTTVCQLAVAPNVTFTNPQTLPVTITYNINGGANATVNVGSSTTATVAAPTGTAGSFTYNLVDVFYQAVPSCTNPIAGSATVTITATVGTPTVPAPAATTICQGSAPTAYTTSATAATTYNWSVTGAGNSIAGTGTTGTVTWAAGFSGIATVSVTANGCNGPSAPATTTVTVRPTPTATIGGTATVCQLAASPNITFTNPMALPVTVTYNINGGANATINVGASTTATVAAPTGTSGTFAYNLVNVFYQAAPTCSNVIAGSATITVTTTVGTPTVPAPAATTICQGSAPTAYTTSATGATTYNWSVTGAGNSIAGTGTTGTVTWGAAFTGVATISVTANGCNGPSAPSSTTVTVNPTPTATINGTTSVCQSVPAPTITFTNAMVLPVTVTYNINGGANTTINIAGSSTNTLAAPTGTAGTFIYNLVNVFYQAAPACTNALVGSATVTVRPTPTATIGGTTTVCQGAAAPNITFTNPQVLPVIVTYNINGGANTIVNVGASTTALVAAPTGAAGTFVYNLVSVDYQTAPSCTNAVAGSATVTVRPTPTATISGTTTVCQLAASPNVTFTNPMALPVTVTYKINAGANTTINVAAGSTATVAAPTGVSGVFAYNLVDVFYQAAPTCTNPLVGSATISVTQSVGVPLFTLGVSSIRCQAAGTVTYDAAATNTTGITYSLDAPSLGGGNTIDGATGAVTYAATWSGTTTITASAAGCNGPKTSVHVVTVNPLPAVPVISGAPLLCNDATNKIYQVANHGATSSYTWTVPGAILAKTFDANLYFILVDAAGPTGSGDIQLTETIVSTGCSASAAPFNVIVSPVAPGAVVAGPVTVCQDDAGVSYSVPDNAGSTYSWIVTGASITSADPTLHTIDVSFPASGSVNISVSEMGAGGCLTVHTGIIVTVKPTPAITNMNSAICSGGTFTTTPANGTNGTVPPGTTYTWAAPAVTGGITGGLAGAAAANISGTLVNPTSTFQSATYTVTPKTGTCTGADFTVTILVNPKPVVNNLTSIICSAGSFSTTPVDGADGIIPAGTTYSWPAPVVTGGITGGTPGTNAAAISGTLTNPTNTFATATYTVTPKTGSCTGATFTVTVTVNPKPAITNMNETICSAGSFTTIPANGANGIVPATTTYTWAAPSVTGGLTGGAPGTAAANISGTLTNPTNTTQIAIYTVTPTDGACTGADFTVTVTVNPVPAIANMVNTTCSSSAFTSAPANGIDGVVPVGTTYSWGLPSLSGGLTGEATGTNAANISGNLVNSTNIPQTATYTVTPKSGSCTGATFTVTVTIDPKPAISNMTATICSTGSFTAAPVNVTNGIVPAATTYTWAAPAVTGGILGGSAGTNAADISGSLTNPTNTVQTAIYTVTPKSGSCTGMQFTVTVTVDPKPAISNMTATICSGSSFTSAPADGTNGIVPVGTTYTWGAPVLNPLGSITGSAAQGVPQVNISQTLANITSAIATATYTVTPVSGGCTGATFTVTVTVNPMPAVNNLTAIICSGGSFVTNPADGTDGIVPPGTGYTWPAPAISGSITGGAAGTNALTIGGSLTNTSNSVQTATYTVTPKSGSCTGATFTVIVTVNPKPAITNMTATICSAGSFTAVPTNIVNGIVPGATAYTWSAPAVTGGITGGASGTGAANISGTLVNPTNAAQTATYTVTPATPDCTGATFTVVVTVDPKPAIANLTATSCSDGIFVTTPLNVTDGIVPFGTTYTWAAPAVTGAMTGGLAGTAAASISGTLHNPTNIPQTATYTVFPTSGSCTGLSFTVIVTVNPKPAVTNMVATICSAGSFVSAPLDGTNGVVPVPTTYTWPAPVVTGGLSGGAAGTNAADISGTLTNPTNSVQTATYTVTPKSGSCTGSTFTVIVTVNPKPGISNMVSAICSGTSFTSVPVNGVDGVVPAGTTYTWSVPVLSPLASITGGAAEAVPQANISQTLTNVTSSPATATYTVTPVSGGCTGATFTVTVTVNPTPAITPMVSAICSGGSFTVTPADVANGIIPAGTTYSWPAPVVSGGITGGTTGTNAANISGTLTNPTNVLQTAIYTVTPKSGSCTGATFTVTVTVDPKATITPMTATICSAGTFTSIPTDGVNGVIPGGTTYSWPVPVVSGGLTGGAIGSGAANISGTLTNPTNAAQTAIYTVTPLTGGCTGASFTVTVSVNPMPAITDMTGTVCSDGTFTRVPADGINGIVPAGTTYTWAAPVVTGSMTGGAAGAAAANISGTLNNPTNVLQTATYTVFPTSGSCSGASFTVTITVNPKPGITNMVSVICSGGSFVSSPLNGTDGIVPAGTIYSWSAPAVTGGITGGTSGTGVPNISGTLNNPTSTAQTATYTVTPVSGSCTGATFTVTVTVNPKPAITNMTAAICSAGTFTTTPVDATNGIVPAATGYTWGAPTVTGGLTGGLAGAGASISGTLTNPTNTSQIAIYTVTPLSGSCTGSDFTVTVTVNPVPAVNNLTATICSAGTFTTAPVNFTDGIVPTGTTYTWPAPAISGSITGGAAGTSAANISGTLTNTSNTFQTATYTVTPTSGGCPGATFTVVVTVDPKPAVTNMTALICGGGTFTSTPANLTNGIVPAGTTYTWTAPAVTGGLSGGAAGTNAANISGTLVNPTNIVQQAVYTVTPKAGACTGPTFTVTVTVDPTPAINAMTATTCSAAAFTSTPVNLTNGIVPAGTTYTWVAPVVTGGLTGGAGGLGVSITGNLVNPTNTSQTATYTVIPTSGSCTGTSFTLTVTVNPVPAITPMTAVICSGGSFTSTPVNVTDGIVPAGTTYSWTAPAVTGGVTGGLAGGGLSISGTLTNPTNAIQTATYTVTPTSGICVGTAFTVTVTVNPKPAVNNMIATICSGGSFTAAPADGTNGVVPLITTYTWAAPTVSGGITGGAAGTAAANISGTLTNPTNTPQTAVYTVTPTAGSCVGATFTVTVTVDPKPAVMDMTSTICSGGLFTTTPLNITNGIVPAGTTYTWGAAVVTGGVTGGIAGGGISITGTLVNPTNVVQTATYTVTPTSGSCIGSTFTVTVTVNPKPGITNMTALICSGGTFTSVPADGVNGIVPTGTTYSWAAPAVTGGLTGGAAGTGAVNINGTLSNPTNSQQTATYTVTPVSGGCTGATFTVTVTVDPKPAVTSMTAVICSGGTFLTSPVNLTNGIVPAGTSYSWAAPTVTGGLTGGIAGIGASITGTLTNPTNAPQVAIYTVTPTAVGCVGADFTVTVTVNPTPVISAMTSTICSAGSFTASPVNGTDGIVPAGTTYTWPAPVVTGGIAGGIASSGASVNGTLTNPTSIAQTATYTVTPTSGSCTGSTFTVTVTVDPKPAITPMTATICSGGSFTATPANGVNGIVPLGTTYTWPVPVMTGGLTGGALGTAAANISGTLVNPTNTVQTATYTVTPLSGSCTGATFTVTVTVNPMPIVSNMSSTICSAGSFTVTPANFTNGVVPFGTTYTWAAPAVTGGITGGVAGGGPDVTGSLTNPTNTVQTATYTVTPVSGSCTGSTFTVTVTVNPMPAVTAMTATICNGTSFTTTPANGANGIVPAGTTYTWGLPVVTGGMAGGVPGSGTSITGTLFNSTITPQTATYTVTPVSGSCTGAPFFVTVTVNPSTGPTGFTTGALEVCQDAPNETYTATATSSTSIVYSAAPAAAGTINAATGEMDWAPAFFGNATITATSTGLCGTTVGNVTVRVKQLPGITTSPVDRVTCEFGQVNFDVTAFGSDLTYEWLVDPNTGIFAPVSGAAYNGESTSTLQIWSADRTMNNYKYKVKVSGCLPDVTSAVALLTVNTSPELTLHPSDLSLCLGDNGTMNADATGTSIAWQWYVNKGAGFVLVTPDANFSGETTKTLTITGALGSFNNWIFRAKATGVCGVPTFTNFARLSVVNPPSVTLQPLAKVICENGSTSFLSNGSAYLSLQWQVSTNGGGTWTDIIDDAVYLGSSTNQLSLITAPVTFNNNQYRLAFIGACTTVNSNAVILTVNPNPIVSFPADINACGGVPVVLNGNPSGGTLPYAQHRWTGDVAPLSSYTIQSPTFNSLIAGTYNINYKVTDSKGCTANDDLVVIVDSPAADFTQDIDGGCTPLAVQFTKDMTGIASFSWDFGDGTPAETAIASPLHTFVNSNPSTIGYYNVKLTVMSPGGCIKTYSSLVTVYPAIDATFTASTNIICSGGTITYAALPGASKYVWDYGDGVSAPGANVASHLYINNTAAPQVLQVRLTTTSFYNCIDVKTLSITVMPAPQPQFTALPVSQVFNSAGNPVTFTNATSNPATWTYLWKFGDGTTSVAENPVHSYTNVGTFNVVLIVSNANCSDSVKHPVTVVPIPPVANFDPIPSGCEPLNMTINNTSLNADVPGTTYLWNFGDGGISTAKNPTYTYFDPGTYTVELVVTGPDGATSNKSQVVNSYPSPKAYFELAPKFVYVNDEAVHCFNLSQPTNLSYLWEFGDGDTSKIKEPFHKYMTSGVYDVTLWAFSANGCSDKYILSPGVTVEPAGEIRFATVFTPNLDGPIEGPPTTATMDQFFYPPIQEKLADYKLQVFNRLGVLIFESHDVNTPWNGYYKGKLCMQGVYVWYVEGKYTNGKPFKKVGDITLLH